MSTAPYVPTTDGISLRVKVQPGASRTAFAGLVGDRLKVRLAARAVEGAANRALLEFFSDYFAIPKTSVSIKHGLTARDKTVVLCGDRQSLMSKLDLLVSADRDT